MNEYFPKLKSLAANVKVELHSFDYVAKGDVRNATGVDISNFAKTADLANSKSDI